MVKIQRTQCRIIGRDGSIGHSILTEASEIKRNDIVSLVYVFLDFRPVCCGRFATFTEPHEYFSFVGSGFVNVQQRHFKQFAVAEHITVKGHAAGAPASHSFPSDLLSPSGSAGILADLPVFYAAVSVTVVFFRETASWGGLVLVTIFLDYRHQGFRVVVVEHDLPCFSALQSFARKLLYRWKSTL